MHWLLLVGLWILTGFALKDNVPNDYILVIWFSLGVGFAIWGFIMQSRISNQLFQKQLEVKQEAENKKIYLEKSGLSRESKSYNYLSGLEDLPEKGTINISVNGGLLNLLQYDMKKKYQIPISDINFYTVKGDMRQEIKTIGGNATLTETVIAEGMLGTAAAMKKNQPIQTTKTIDERKTIINATINDKNTYLFFQGPDLYNYLLENLPEKEQSFVTMSK